MGGQEFFLLKRKGGPTLFWETNVKIPQPFPPPPPQEKRTFPYLLANLCHELREINDQSLSVVDQHIKTLGHLDRIISELGLPYQLHCWQSKSSVKSNKENVWIRGPCGDKNGIQCFSAPYPGICLPSVIPVI